MLYINNCYTIHLLRSWNLVLVSVILVSLAGYIGLNIGLQSLRLSTSLLNSFGGSYDTSIQVTAAVDENLVHVYLHILSSPTTWLATLLTLAIALLPDVVVRVARWAKHK